MDSKDLEQMNARKIAYIGKRIHTHLVAMQNDIYASGKEGVTNEELGVFGELDLVTLIERAAELGNVPDYRTNDNQDHRFKIESIKKHEGV